MVDPNNIVKLDEVIARVEVERFEEPRGARWGDPDGRMTHGRREEYREGHRRSLRPGDREGGLKGWECT
jgi:hypothetical protein